MCREPSPASFRTRFVFVAGALGVAGVVSVAGCGDDAGSASDAAPAGLVGGWSNAAGQLACFARDGRVWLGDSSADIGGPSFCALSEGGAGFSCSAREGNAAFAGTLDREGDELALAIEPCSSSSADDCSASYSRDASMSCE